MRKTHTDAPARPLTARQQVIADFLAALPDILRAAPAHADLVLTLANILRGDLARSRRSGRKVGAEPSRMTMWRRKKATGEKEK